MTTDRCVAGGYKVTVFILLSDYQTVTTVKQKIFLVFCIKYRSPLMFYKIPVTISVSQTTGHH